MPQIERSHLQLPDKHLQTLQILLGIHVPQAEVLAYGSRVTGGSHEGSDLDLVLRNPNNPGQEVKGLMELQEALEESNIPILVDVHQWAHLPHAFHHNIESAYVVLQSGAPPSDN